ncbi:hypothetical protein Patl1_16156 [Pistacia atlantica]|uniref:Uncharacterized protein n=1 Tax=Pistacia atlantica TaxID=434234 RepID=A0ACC1B7S0_9ROSI|nr:hypothetical protein Patl1_16156 [Pistacia atlantica]
MAQTTSFMLLFLTSLILTVAVNTAYPTIPDADNSGTFEPHLLVEYSELEKEREGGEKGPNLRLFLRCDILSFH